MNIENIRSVYGLNKYLNAGGDINAPVNETNLLLHLLTRTNKDYKLIKKVIENGIDVNFTDKWGENALFKSPSFNEIKLLLNKNINVNHLNKCSESCLTSNLSTESMSLLFEHGCDPLSKNQVGDTFAHQLIKSPMPIDLFDLITKMVPKDIVNDRGQTIFSKLKFTYNTKSKNRDKTFHQLDYLIENKIEVNFTSIFNHYFESCATQSRIEKIVKSSNSGGDMSFLDYFIEKKPELLLKYMKEKPLDEILENIEIGFILNKVKARIEKCLLLKNIDSVNPENKKKRRM